MFAALALAAVLSTDFMPVQALELGPDVTVILQKGRFTCPEGAARAFWVQSNGIIVPGCWQTKDDTLILDFEDGDHKEFKSRNSQGSI